MRSPLGATRVLKADFRLVTATNLDLKRLVSEDHFREDLYYRLNVVKISLPPLRERKGDIPLLVDHFIHKYNMLRGKTIHDVSAEVLSFLLGYPFPGNIRELENIIEYAFIACKGDVIGMEHLPGDLVEGQKDQRPLLSTKECEEAENICAILEQYPHSRPAAAKALGMSRTTLWRKMNKYGITGA